MRLYNKLLIKIERVKTLFYVLDLNIEQQEKPIN